MKKKTFDLYQLGRRLVPHKRRVKLKQRFIQAGYKQTNYKSIAKIFILTLVLTLMWYIFLFISANINLYEPWFIIVSFIIFCILCEILLIFSAWIILNVYLDVKSYSRVQNIEQNLPLFLREFSTNLRAGREFVDALEDSMTPQLGALNDDIQSIVIDIRSGKMTEMILKNYANRYDSYAINETFEIILEAYQGGGGLADIIERIAENLEVIHYLKKNAIASVSNYIIFTTLVSLIIAPLLFALSYNLLWLIKTLLDRLIVSGATPSVLRYAGQLDISFTDFKIFSRVGVGIISGSAASIIGIIRKGSLRGSPVIILIFILLALLSYEIAFALLKYLFQVLYSLS